MLKKIVFKSGVNREKTRYCNEGGWYDCDKIRFRQGSPQKIGGWQRISSNVYEGICRSLWSWLSLGSAVYTGVGTNTKFYLSLGGAYFDATPVRYSSALSSSFTATTGLSTLSVYDPGHGAVVGAYVIYNGATGLGGNLTTAVLNGTSFLISSVTDASTYTITTNVVATSSDTGKGGTPRAVYYLNPGAATQSAQLGWGAGGWGTGSWGIEVTNSLAPLRLWSQSNYGQNLVFGYRGGPLYYWDAGRGIANAGVNISIASPAVCSVASSLVAYEGAPIMFVTSGVLPTGVLTGITYYVRNYSAGSFNISATPSGALINTSGTQSGTQSLSWLPYNLTTIQEASDVPIVQNYIFVSDTYRFVFAFGCNDYASSTQDPLLIRWSDQENAAMWTPALTNQAGSLRLTHGSQIITALQSRQEVLVWTDSTIYSLQYLGYPIVWGSEVLSDNISIINQNAVSVASGVVYWMGSDKFYKYDGRVQTLNCDLREYIFNDFNNNQDQQVFSGTNEGFNEVWWFYCSNASTVVDKYVIYNYSENIWYYGTMGRTAWLDTGILPNPLAATYSNNLVYHESGIDNNQDATTVGIEAYITSTEFDLNVDEGVAADGYQFALIRKILPDLTFRGSTVLTPSATFYIYPLYDSGSGYLDPSSLGGVNSSAIVKMASANVEEFTEQLFLRVRGRQFAIKIVSTGIGVMWQLGATRIEFRQDGRRGAITL
jgi:hypothetical protein